MVLIKKLISFFAEKKGKAKDIKKPYIAEITEGKKFNGKFYGSDKKGFSIYVNSKKINVSKDEIEEYNKYNKERIARNEALKKEKEKNEKEDLIKNENKKNVKPFNLTKKEANDLADKIKNKNFNGKVYGSSKNGYSIYLKNEKVSINEREKELLDMVNLSENFPVNGSYSKDLHYHEKDYSHYAEVIDLNNMLWGTANEMFDLKLSHYQDLSLEKKLRILPYVSVDNYSNNKVNEDSFNGKLSLMKVSVKDKYHEYWAYQKGEIKNGKIKKEIERKIKLDKDEFDEFVKDFM